MHRYVMSQKICPVAETIDGARDDRRRHYTLGVDVSGNLYLSQYFPGRSLLYNWEAVSKIRGRYGELVYVWAAHLQNRQWPVYIDRRWRMLGNPDCHFDRLDIIAAEILQRHAEGRRW